MLIVWTDYMNYRVNLRGFDKNEIEKILKYSEERYIDTVTSRSIVVGNHSGQLVMIPYEQTGEEMTPVTIHSVTRQQINFRLKTGRLGNE